MEKVIDETDVQFQESMWIEIIRRMESIYAELANSQAEIERSSKELMEAKGFTDNIIRSMVDALIVLDHHGNIRMVNQAALDLSGRHEEEVIGKPIDIILDEDDKGKLPFIGRWGLRSIENGAIHDLEVRCRRSSGEKIPMAFSSSVMKDSQGESVGVVIVAKDLRETKRLLAEAAVAEAERAKVAELERAYKELQQLQAQLIQSEKLASMGQMAASVAHEINNPLAGTLTYIKLMLKRLNRAPLTEPELENFERYLLTIEKEINRCSGIVRNLLDFSRQTEPSFQPVNINTIVEKALDLVNHQIITLQNIKIEKRLSPLPQTVADFAQLQQAFMNIALNASEAMKDGGVLSISTRWLKDQRQVKIEFKDTGCGVPKEDLSKIFDPFFTTKKKEGTGLGLSVVYKIINKHRGTIDVDSELGEGTTFIIRLPLITLEDRSDKG